MGDDDNVAQGKSLNEAETLPFVIVIGANLSLATRHLRLDDEINGENEKNITKHVKRTQLQPPGPIIIGNKKLWDITDQFRAVAAGT